ncbi:MAG: Flp pilus assembly complex ATPase component TadA [Clostridia bacterium]|nr:Flp pilus assembly complex ATPase component TadA [Clostridia bacterium]
MFKQLLPINLATALSEINFNLINEVRLRANKPIVVNVAGKCFYLSNIGVTSKASEAIICDAGIISGLIKIVSNNSLYSINDQLINGYVPYIGGVRIGVAGEVVSEHGNIKTVKNITSVNIRIPHLIKNCSLSAYGSLVNNGCVYSTLILSSPGAGKTTFVKDLIMQLSKRNLNLSILVVDERGELSGSNSINLGDNVDVILNSTKKFAFQNGIRSLNPDVVVTDEINLDSDLETIEEALTCGVKVIATIHAKNINDLKNKKSFAMLLNKQLFNRYVVLNNSCGPGTLEGVYNESMSCVCC